MVTINCRTHGEPEFDRRIRSVRIRFLHKHTVMKGPNSSTSSGPTSSPHGDQDAGDSPPSVARASTRLVALPRRGFVENQLHIVLSFLSHLGQMAQMTAGTLRALFRRPFETKSILTQIDTLGVASIGSVAVTSIFIGMVMAVQFAFGLRKFGGMEYTGRVVGLTFARELAPTFTAVIVGGRIGAGMAAEVGSMNVTEQVDAIRALGADPLKKLVLPRLLASVVVMLTLPVAM